MEIDEEKVDEAVLALLYLATFKDKPRWRAWKGHDWDALDRLHEKGMIDDPVGKTKSVVFTEEGLAESKRLVLTNEAICAPSLVTASIRSSV